MKNIENGQKSSPVNPSALQNRPISYSQRSHSKFLSVERIRKFTQEFHDYCITSLVQLLKQAQPVYLSRRKNNHQASHSGPLLKNNTILFKKHEMASHLMESIPLKFKKQLRLLLDSYEEERLQRTLDSKIIESERAKDSVNVLLVNLQNQNKDLADRLCKSEKEVQRLNILLAGQKTREEAQKKIYAQEQLRKQNQFISNQEKFRQNLKADLDNIRVQYKKLSKQNQEQARIISKQQEIITGLRQMVQSFKQESDVQSSHALSQVSATPSSPIDNKVSQSQSQSRNSLMPPLSQATALKKSVYKRMSTQKDLSISERSSKSATSSRNLGRNLKLSIRKKPLSKSSSDFSNSPEDNPDEFGKEKVVEKKKLKRMFRMIMFEGKTKTKDNAKPPTKKAVLTQITKELGFSLKEEERFLQMFGQP